MELIEVAKQENAIAVLALLLAILVVVAGIYVVRSQNAVKSRNNDKGDDKTDDTLSEVVKLLGHALIEITGTLQNATGTLQAMSGTLDNISAVAAQQNAVLVSIREKQINDNQALAQLNTDLQKATERHEILSNNVTQTLKPIPDGLQHIVKQNATLPEAVAGKVTEATEKVVKTVLRELKAISGQLESLRDFAHFCPNRTIVEPPTIKPVAEIDKEKEDEPETAK